MTEDSIKNDYYSKKLLTEDYLNSREGRASLIFSILRENIDLLSVKNIVEIGSGSGILKKHLSSYFKNRIIGIEINKDIIFDSENTLVTDGVTIPLKSSTVDLVICNNVIEHATNKNALIEEIHRILIPNGFAYIASPLKYTLVESHYNLPFLSWLPSALANSYLTITKRGYNYDIDHPTYAELVSLFRTHNFSFKDLTTSILIDEKYPIKEEFIFYRKFFKSFPRTILSFLLKLFSSQQIFLLQKHCN